MPTERLTSLQVSNHTATSMFKFSWAGTMHDILQHRQHHQQQTTTTTTIHSSVFTHRPVWETFPFNRTRRPHNQSIHSSINTTVTRTTHYTRQDVPISQSRSSSGCQQQGTGVGTGNGSPMVYTANRRAATITALSGASPELRRGEKRR